MFVKSILNIQLQLHTFLFHLEDVYIAHIELQFILIVTSCLTDPMEFTLDNHVFKAN